MAKQKNTFDVKADLKFGSIAPVQNTAKNESEDVMYIGNDKIKDSPFNKGMPMDGIEELAESMRVNGLYDPILVYDLGDGTYEIISGHRRRIAWCVINKNKTIRAIVRPYEKDIEKRFALHTEANTHTREKNLEFWTSRIAVAKEILAGEGFDGSRGTKTEEVTKLTSMLGISQAQIYRYESFSKLVPELQDIEKKGWASVVTLYGAASLSAEQQKELAKRIVELKDARQSAYAASPKEFESTFEISRDEFSKIVTDIKNGERREPAGIKRRGYAERAESAKMSFIKTLKNSKTGEDRREALSIIAELRAELDAIEEDLKK